jgi:SAM-dependent methyltransferase
VSVVPQDYFEYERRLWYVAVLPLLGRAGISLGGLRVLDAGCGHGGMLAGLRETWPDAIAVGIDIDPEMIAGARARAHGVARFACADLFRFADDPFDAVFLRDVLEHIPRFGDALARALALLRPGGVLFASYTPFYSPFGGHQHTCKGPGAYTPWLQFLPTAVFRRLARAEGNAYKSRERLQADIETVLAARLTLGRMQRLLDRLDAPVVLRERYFVRPDYRIKFGLPAIRMPRRMVPALAELFCTAEALMLRKSLSAVGGGNYGR